MIFPDRVMILIEQEIGIESDKELLAGTFKGSIYTSESGRRVI